MRFHLGAVAFALLASQASATPDDLVEQFVNSCLGSLPDFADIGTSLVGADFRESSETQWIRETDGAVFMIMEADDRLVCMAGLIGDHTTQFTTAIESHLANNTLGPMERKQFEGRTLYLVQAPKGLTLLEVIPPQAATTFIVANAQKNSP